jgi:CubicO group peptidase (beta-lactamase class C family)
MNNRALFSLLLGAILMASQGCATMKEPPEISTSPKNPAIDEAMQPFVDDGQLAGVVTLVADDHQILHLSALGQRDLKKHLPMRTDTIFWIASMTKPTVATAILMLQEQGKLSVDDPVSKYIPEFANIKTPSGKPANLTIHHLLTHTSGLQESPRDAVTKAHNLQELIPSFTDRPTKFEPGTKWEYCQSGINSLGRIIEIVSGQSFPDFMQTHLYGPLGMTDTTFYPSPEQLQRLATTYIMQDGKLKSAKIKLLPGPPGDRSHYAAPNGGLFSTARDYTRFAQMLLNNGTLDGRQYLTPQFVKLMTSIQTDDIPKVGFIPGSAWGLAVGIVRESQGMTAMLSPGTFGHGGAYGTQVWIDPTRKRIYLLLIQRGDLPNSDNSDFRLAFQSAAAPPVN